MPPPKAEATRFDPLFFEEGPIQQEQIEKYFTDLQGVVKFSGPQSDPLLNQKSADLTHYLPKVAQFNEIN